MSRRPAVPPTDDEQSIRELVDELRSAPLREKLKTAGAIALFVPFLAVLFLASFLLFGGWRLFEDHLPAWLGRLLTFLFVAGVAWALLKPLFDRWERRQRGP